MQGQGTEAQRVQPRGPSASQVTKISPYYTKNPYTAISKTLQSLSADMNGRNVVEEVAAAVRRGGDSPTNVPMSSYERDGKIQNINSRSEQSLNKPGEDFRVALLSKMYKQSKKRALELGIKSQGDGVKNSAIPLKVHGQQAARVYQAISSLLYSSINMYKSEALEKFITKKSATLPCSIFDLSQWQAAIGVARDVRNRGIGKDTATWPDAHMRPGTGTGASDAWMTRTPGPQDSNRRIPSRGHGGGRGDMGFNTADILGSDWGEDGGEFVDVATMRFGAGLEEEEEDEEEMHPPRSPVNNNWVHSPGQSPPRTAAQAQRPQATVPLAAESAGSPPLSKLLGELSRLEGQLRRNDSSKNQTLTDVAAVRHMLVAAQAQISQFINMNAQSIPKAQHLQELEEVRSEANMQLQMQKQSFGGNSIDGPTSPAHKTVTIAGDTAISVATSAHVPETGTSMEVQSLTKQLHRANSDFNTARELAAKDLSDAKEATRSSEVQLQELQQALQVKTLTSDALTSQIAALKVQLAQAEVQTKATAAAVSVSENEEVSTLKALLMETQTQLSKQASSSSEQIVSLQGQVKALTAKIATGDTRHREEVEDLAASLQREMSTLKAKLTHSEMQLKSQGEQHAEALHIMDTSHKAAIEAEQITSAEVVGMGRPKELLKPLSQPHMHKIPEKSDPHYHHANMANNAVVGILTAASASHICSRSSSSSSPAQTAVSSIIGQASANHVRTQSPKKREEKKIPEQSVVSHTHGADMKNRLIIAGITVDSIPGQVSHESRTSMMHRHHHEISTKSELKNTHANEVLEHIKELQRLRAILSEEVSKCVSLKIDNDSLTSQLEQQKESINRMRQREAYQADEFQEQLQKETSHLRRVQADHDAQVQEVERLANQLSEEKRHHVKLEKTITELRHDGERLEKKYEDAVYTHAHVPVVAANGRASPATLVELRDMTEVCAKLKEDLLASEEHCKSLQGRIEVDSQMVDVAEAQLKTVLSREKHLEKLLHEQSNENRVLVSTLADMEGSRQKAMTPQNAASMAPVWETQSLGSHHTRMAGNVAHSAIHGALHMHESSPSKTKGQDPDTQVQEYKAKLLDMTAEMARLTSELEHANTLRPSSAMKGSRPSSGTTDTSRRISFSVEHTETYVVGAKCTANFANMGQWYAGQIVKVHGTGVARTFDIAYDDGDAEQGKPMAEVKVTPAAAAAPVLEASEEVLALRAEVKDLKSKVSLLDMTVRAKTNDMEALNKEFMSEAMEIDKQQKASDKKLKAAEAEASAAHAEIVLLKAQLDDANIAASANQAAFLNGGKFKPDGSLDSIESSKSDKPLTPIGSISSVGELGRQDSKVFNPNSSMHSITSQPSERGSIVADSKTVADIASKYEARLATVEATNYQKLATMKHALVEKEKALKAMTEVAKLAEKAEHHTLDLLRNMEANALEQQVLLAERQEDLDGQRKVSDDLQKRLKLTLEKLNMNENALRGSPLMQEQEVNGEESEREENQSEGNSRKAGKGGEPRVLCRPREEGESAGTRPSPLTASKTEKNASVHMQRIVRGFLGRLAVKHIMIERSAKLHGILVAFRPAGTIQGQAGWYVAKGELFYFALDKGEFVLLAGPLSANDYDAVLDDMRAQNITAHTEFSGEIEVDRMGLHAARWQLQSMKAQLEAANFELGPEGALYKYIDALKADIKKESKQVISWTEKHVAAIASLTEKAAEIQRVEAAMLVEKQTAKQYRADLRMVKQELEIERMGSKSPRSGYQEQIYSPRGGDSAAVMTQAKASVIRAAKKLQVTHFASIVLFQAYIRRFLIARRMYQQRIRELASKTSVLMALPGSTQGKAGWYMAPDGFIYYFVQRHNEWIMTAGPLREDQYYEILDMSVRVVPGIKYARVTSRPHTASKKGSSRASIIKTNPGSRPTSGSRPVSGVGLVSQKKVKHHYTSTVSNALIKCNFELAVERADLDGDVFMDKKTKMLYLAVSVERLVHHSALGTNATALSALIKIKK